MKLQERLLEEAEAFGGSPSQDDDGNVLAHLFTKAAAQLDLYEAALPVFERVTRMAHTLASDVPITAESRKHIQAAYDALAALNSTDTALTENRKEG